MNQTTLPAEIEALCAELYEKKALDIVAISVSDMTVIADWFIVCSGRVPQQVKALCDDLEDKAAAMGLEQRRKEGYSAGRWIVLDYADILVHLFVPEERQYYKMERLWDTGTSVVRYSELRDAEAEAAAARE